MDSNEHVSSSNPLRGTLDLTSPNPPRGSTPVSQLHSSSFAPLSVTSIAASINAHTPSHPNTETRLQWAQIITKSEENDGNTKSEVDDDSLVPPGAQTHTHDAQVAGHKPVSSSSSFYPGQRLDDDKISGTRDQRSLEDDISGVVEEPLISRDRQEQEQPSPRASPTSVTDSQFGSIVNTAVDVSLDADLEFAGEQRSGTPQLQSQQQEHMHIHNTTGPSPYPPLSYAQRSGVEFANVNGSGMGPAITVGVLPDPNRSLNVNDALGYLDEVKNRFQSKPDVYNHFLEIMKDFKSKRIDTPRVIERVSLLFAGHPTLIQGFNTFLPPGYRIECMTDCEDGGSMIRVTTPQGTMMQSQNTKADEDSTSHSQIQTTWIVGTSVQNGPEDEKKGKEDACGTHSNKEESCQLHASSALPLSRPDSLNANLNVDMDPQPVSEQRQQQQQRETSHPSSLLLPQEQPTCPSDSNLRSNHGSTSPSPAPPSSSAPHLHRGMSAPVSTSASVLASVSGGGSANISGVGSFASALTTPTAGFGSLDPTRSLNVNDALGYLDEVKNRFQTNPDVYNHFLEIMKDFKSQRIDTPGVIERVSLLFAGHPALIQGFNTFLPPGYRIECMVDPDDGGNSMIRVTTPQGTMMQSARCMRSDDGERAGDVHFSLGHSHSHPSGNHFALVHINTPTPVSPVVGATGINTVPNALSAAAPCIGGLNASISTGASLFAAAASATLNSTSSFPPGTHPSELQPTEQALEYVNRIKERYADDPASYQLFLDLLQNFNRNPEEVLKHIVALFSNAPDLLEEFKMFLPKDGMGFGVNAGDNGTVADGQSNLMKMFAQSVEVVQAQMQAQQQARTQAQGLDAPTKARRKDKDRGDDKERTQMHGSATTTPPQKRKRKPVEKDVGAIASSILKTLSGSAATGMGPSKAKKSKLHHDTPASHRDGDREVAGLPYNDIYQHQPQSQLPHLLPDVYSQAQFHPPIQHPSHLLYQTQLETQIQQDSTFFDRVHHYLENRETYDEFLKLINLFTQELINLRTLVFQAKSFLGDSELMAQFREMVGWEERSGTGGNNGTGGGMNNADGVSTTSASNVVGQVVKPNKADLSIQYGPSYRRLPPSETQVVCSGRDAFCNSVLNDEWVSHPSWVSEDSGFVAHKKNVYEEALHRSEEERHEYDFYLEAMNKTVSTLEPSHIKILQMSDLDRTNFKFKPNWNGMLKTIHQRLLKKVYGRDAGMEVVQAIQDNPALAIPIVFQRLKQKEEEWKRAQREWNKVWREVDARNYWKSLDHQGVTFKMSDKKTITTKAFVTNIELVRQQQVARRASLVDSTFGRGPPQVTSSSSSHIAHPQAQNNFHNYSRPRYQLAYTIEDISVLQDAIKLVLSFLDRSHGTISVYDRKKIEQFIRYFTPLFFMFYQREFDSAFVIGGSTTVGGQDLEDIVLGDGFGNGFADDDGSGFGSSNNIGPSSSVAGSTRSKNGKRVSGDIRKKVLKASQSQSQSLLQGQLDRSARRTRSVASASASASVSASAPPSVSGSRAPSPNAPGLTDVEMRDNGSTSAKNPASTSMGLSIVNPIPSGKLLNNASVGFQLSTSGPRKQHSRRGLFFANTPLYVLLRLLNLLYARLLLCKRLGAELAEAEKATIAANQQQNPSETAFVPGTLPGTPLAFANVSTTGLDTTLTFGAEHFYGHLLECCERLFDNQIDQATFEDTARYMFGMKAYNVFTIDKVIGAIIKQVQLILLDNKSKELVQLLQKERDNPSMSLQDQNSYREKAGAIVGSDDHFYRINYLLDSRSFTIQLLSKDDSKDEDTQAMVEKWEKYIDAFQADSDPSAPLPRGRYPFLRRTLREDKLTPLTTKELFTRNHMETRFCMRTYRMFFVSHTEDMLYWQYPKDVNKEHRVIVDKRVQRLLTWIQSVDVDGWKGGLKTT